MRRYKKSIALGVVILLLVGLGIYIGTDKARRSAILIAAAEAWTGGTFQIEGDVSFSIGRVSSISAERVTFALPSAGSAGIATTPARRLGALIARFPSPSSLPRMG